MAAPLPLGDLALEGKEVIMVLEDSKATVEEDRGVMEVDREDTVEDRDTTALTEEGMGAIAHMGIRTPNLQALITRAINFHLRLDTELNLKLLR